MSTPSIVFILGPPGAGKTTLGAKLAREFHGCHISVGDLLRRLANANESNSTPHQHAKAIAHSVNTQELLDGKVLALLIKAEVERLVSRDLELESAIVFVDGFPRCVDQLVEFEKIMMKPRLVLFFHCAKEVAKKRYLARKLEGRKGDDEALFERRFGDFVIQNEAVVRTYRERGVVLEIDTGYGMEGVWKELCGGLKKNGF